MRIVAALLSRDSLAVHSGERPSTFQWNQWLRMLLSPLHRSLCLALMPHRRSPAAPQSGDLAIESALDQEEVSDPDPLSRPCSFPYTYPHSHLSPGRLRPGFTARYPRWSAASVSRCSAVGARQSDPSSAAPSSIPPCLQRGMSSDPPTDLTSRWGNRNSLAVKRPHPLATRSPDAARWDPLAVR